MVMKKMSLLCLLTALYLQPMVYAEGFTANWVDIVRTNNGQYRVLIKYSNVEVGEYREAFVDFKSKKEAIDIFQKLARGATFYWGDSKKIFFPKEVEKLRPY